jgi:uncharacterized protein YceK
MFISKIKRLQSLPPVRRVAGLGPLGHFMRFLRTLLLICALSCAGCSAIGRRVVGGGYFCGVRGDAAMISDRESIDPSSRIHPAMAALDMPFSFIGDVLFLPYDAHRDCQ